LGIFAGKWTKNRPQIIVGLAKKDDFRAITAKNADQKRFTPAPRGNCPQFAKKSEHFDCKNRHFAEF
jgi:hypothetical protein